MIISSFEDRDFKKSGACSKYTGSELRTVFVFVKELLIIKNVKIAIRDHINKFVLQDIFKNFLFNRKYVIKKHIKGISTK